MNRRNFLKNTASASAGVVLANVFNGFGLKALTTSPFGNALLQGTDTDKVLVMIQLGGGNDGLNTVVPLDQLSILNKARPQVILPDSKLLSLSGEDKLALHPALSGLQK
ncbi:MAG TPA: twin-arginine translocation signal domain-containing protein, partial [Chitinophagales bacterium]|nr:twin-arginine translocation signal domain-containing protein [Chitinophagales bacterium]